MEERVSQARNVQLQPEGISIQWDDGHLSAYPHRFLRMNCRCATCVGEWPNQGSLNESTVRADVVAVEYQTVGRYALQFLWSDTHYTGIYPYRVLRDLCQCAECARERETREATSQSED